MSKKQIFEAVLIALSVVFAVVKAIDQLEMLPELDEGMEWDS